MLKREAGGPTGDWFHGFQRNEIGRKQERLTHLHCPLVNLDTVLENREGEGGNRVGMRGRKKEEVLALIQRST